MRKLCSKGAVRHMKDLADDSGLLSGDIGVHRYELEMVREEGNSLLIIGID